MMRRTIILFTIIAAALLVGGGVVLAAPVGEVEPNNSREAAQNIDGSFSLDSDPNIGNKFVDTSQVVPHATVNGTGNNSVDFYSFTVSKVGQEVILDVDGAFVWNDENEDGFDSWVELYDSSGNVLAQNDDAPYSWGQGGSTPFCFFCNENSESWDSYLEYTFQMPGTYYVAVGDNCPPSGGCGVTGLYPIPHGYSYQLQVSLGKVPASLGKAPPEKPVTLDRGHLPVDFDFDPCSISDPHIHVTGHVNYFNQAQEGPDGTTYMTRYSTQLSGVEITAGGEEGAKYNVVEVSGVNEITPQDPDYPNSYVRLDLNIVQEQGTGGEAFTKKMVLHFGPTGLVSTNVIADDCPPSSSASASASATAQ